MTITASKIELAHRCEGSFALPHRAEKHAGQDEGIARHKEWEDAINAGNVPAILAEQWPGYTWRAEVAYAYDVATGTGWEIGVGISRGYGDLGPFAIAGTADAIGRGPDGDLVVVDRKSFDPHVSRSADNGQLHTLALAASRAYGLDSATVALVHEVRSIDVAHLDFFTLETFRSELRGIIERSAAARARVRKGLPLTLVPGDHCRYCPAFHHCPAQRDLALSLEQGAIEVMPIDDDASAARAYEFLQRAKMLTKRLNDVIHARAKEGPIPLGNGRWFGLVASKGQTKLDADIAYEVVRERHGQEIADRAVERKATQVGIERALESLGAGAKAAKEALLEEIKNRGGAVREDTETVKEFAHRLKA